MIFLPTVGVHEFAKRAVVLHPVALNPARSPDKRSSRAPRLGHSFIRAGEVILFQEDRSTPLKKQLSFQLVE